MLRLSVCGWKGSCCQRKGNSTTLLRSSGGHLSCLAASLSSLACESTPTCSYLWSPHFLTGASGLLKSLPLLTSPYFFARVTAWVPTSVSARLGSSLWGCACVSVISPFIVRVSPPPSLQYIQAASSLPQFCFSAFMYVSCICATAFPRIK